MKTLSLLQPWASLIAIGAKKWETRSWKPSAAMLYVIREKGLLIHASAKFDYQNKGLLTYPPFCAFLKNPDECPVSAIIAKVRIGRVIPTMDWVEEFKPHKNPDAATERAFGNYNSGRWAWEILDVEALETPVPAKGSLSIWEFSGRPNVEIREGVA